MKCEQITDSDCFVLIVSNYTRLTYETTKTTAYDM